VTKTVGERANLFEGLIFQVSPTQRLKLATRMGPTLSLTESGSPGPQRPTDPLYIVGNSLSDSPVADLPAFAEARARATTGLTNIRIIDKRPLQLDGLPAYELRATATQQRSGEPMSLYQVVAVDQRTYFLMQGIVGAARAAELLPEFRRVTETFRRTSAR
jgi:hypothetical protein